MLSLKLATWKSLDPIWIALVVLFVRLCIMPMHNSFWLDETLTASTVREGFRSIFATSTIRLQSEACCVLEWLSCAVAAFHLHRLFGTIFAFQYIFAFVSAASAKDGNRAKQLLAGGAATLVLLLPAIPQLRTFATSGKLLSYSDAPTLRYLL